MVAALDLNGPLKGAKSTNNKPLATHQISNRCKNMVIIIFTKTMTAMCTCIRTDRVKIMDEPMRLPAMASILAKDINCTYLYHIPKNG